MLLDNCTPGYIVAGIALLLLCAGFVILWQRLRLQRVQQAASRLRHDVDEMEAAYVNAPVGLAMFDKNLRYVRINQLLAEINGFSIEEHIGKTIREVVPDIAPREEKMFSQVLRSGKPSLGHLVEGTTTAQPGVLRSWRENVYPIFSGDGEVIGVNVAVEEITEEMRLSAALHASELRERQKATELEVVMHAAPAAIFIARDAECLYVIGNAEGNRLLRLRPGENASVDPRSRSKAHVFTIYGDETPLPANQLPMQVAAATGKEVRGAELTYHFENGDVIHMLINASPLRNQAGEIFGAVGAFVDVTPQKQAEQMMIQENRRKDEFLATLAHELRNPLAAIQNGLELMKREPGAMSRTHGIMERQLSHLVRLIDDLLDVSRINSGKLGLKKEKVSVNAVIDDALRVSHLHVGATGHELKVNAPLASLYVEGDVVRLAQALSNLLNNAAKYTPDGGRIRLLAEQDGRNAVIRIIDNGIGIEKEMLPKLFSMYSQLESGRDRRRGGIGIGLSLAKQIVNLHGGELTAESAGAGLGSTFTMRLPLCEGAGSERSAVPQQQGSEIASGRKRILVVDDNADAAQTLGALLEMGGHAVKLAYTGSDAISTAKEFQPEITFVDIGLPDMSGHDVARTLRSATPHNAVLVALTGWGSEKDRIGSKKAGFDFHLVKPTTIDAIRSVLPDLAMPSCH